MKALHLLETLLQEEGLDHAAIQAVYDELPANSGVNRFREALLKQKLMEYSHLMQLFINKTLLPHSQAVLTRVESKRATKEEYKPPTHQRKFHIEEDDRMTDKVAFAAGELPIRIPPPNLNNLHFDSTDERQAVELALEMAQQNELNEAEIILLETLEVFDKSTSAMLVLCWVYLSSGHPRIIETWVKLSISKGRTNGQIMELLCLAEQLQNKHLMASAHYQKLLRQKRVKSIWYLLLAYSQQRSQCLREAAENYRIYCKVGKDPQLIEFANQQLTQLDAS